MKSKKANGLTLTVSSATGESWTLLDFKSLTKTDQGMSKFVDWAMGNKLPAKKVVPIIIALVLSAKPPDLVGQSVEHTDGEWTVRFTGA